MLGSHASCVIQTVYVESTIVNLRMGREFTKKACQSRDIATLIERADCILIN